MGRSGNKVALGHCSAKAAGTIVNNDSHLRNLFHHCAGFMYATNKAPEDLNTALEDLNKALEAPLVKLHQFSETYVHTKPVLFASTCTYFVHHFEDLYQQLSLDPLHLPRVAKPHVHDRPGGEGLAG